MTDAENSLALAVRAADYDRFLAIQLAPRPKRHQLYALTAFQAELARIAETVSEPLLGHIRLAWWREALEEIAAGNAPREHPVVRALADVCKTHPQVFSCLLPMIEARAADLDPHAFNDEDAWLAYLDATAGALHRAWAQLLDEEAAKTEAESITRAARGYAWVGLVRAIPHFAAQGARRFPAPRLARAGIDGVRPHPALPLLVKPLLDEARHLFATAPRWSRRFTALAALNLIAQHRANALRKRGYDPYAPCAPDWKLILRLLRMNATGR